MIGLRCLWGAVPTEDIDDEASGFALPREHAAGPAAVLRVLELFGGVGAFDPDQEEAFGGDRLCGEVELEDPAVVFEC